MCLDKIRKVDLFGQPVRMSYKQDYVFTSVCGGLVTIMLGVCLLVYVSQQAIDIFVNPTFWKTQECDFKSYT